MPFDSLNAFIQMGGHGLYVWLSFTATLLVLGYNLLSPCMAGRQLRRELRRRLRREEALR